MITTLQIDGMRTVHCVRAVYTAFAGVAGIDAAEVSIGRATLEHARALDATALTAAVALAGYVVREIGTDRRRLPTMTTPLMTAPAEPEAQAPAPDAAASPVGDGGALPAPTALPRTDGPTAGPTTTPNDAH